MDDKTLHKKILCLTANRKFYNYDKAVSAEKNGNQHFICDCGRLVHKNNKKHSETKYHNKRVQSISI